LRLAIPFRFWTGRIKSFDSLKINRLRSARGIRASTAEVRLSWRMSPGQQRSRDGAEGDGFAVAFGPIL